VPNATISVEYEKAQLRAKTQYAARQLEFLQVCWQQLLPVKETRKKPV
jgi:hypothetical protein